MTTGTGEIPRQPRKPERGDRATDADRAAAFLLKHGLEQSEVRTVRLGVLLDAIGMVAPLAGEPSENGDAPRLEDAEKTAAQLALLKLLNAVGRHADADVEMFDREQRAERIGPGASPGGPGPGAGEAARG